MAVFKASVRTHPPSEKNSLHHYHDVGAPTYVSAFALVVYWHDPNGTPIAVCQVPGLHRVEVQRPIVMEPFYLVIMSIEKATGFQIPLCDPRKQYTTRKSGGVASLLHL